MRARRSARVRQLRVRAGVTPRSPVSPIIINQSIPYANASLFSRHAHAREPRLTPDFKAREKNERLRSPVGFLFSSGIKQEHSCRVVSAALPSRRSRKNFSRCLRRDCTARLRPVSRFAMLRKARRYFFPMQTSTECIYRGTRRSFER